MNQSLDLDIREAGDDFLESQVQYIHTIQSQYERNAFLGSLNHWIRELEDFGPNATIYQNFLEFFTRHWST